MFYYQKQKDCIAVYGWNPHNSEDDRLIGVITKCDDGYNWFKPSVEIMFTSNMMSVISGKLKELNTNPPP